MTEYAKTEYAYPFLSLEELLALGLPLPLGPGEVLCDLGGCSLPAVFLTPHAALCGACAAGLRIEPGRWHRPLPAKSLTGGEDARRLRGEWYAERIATYMPVERTAEIEAELEDLVERAVRRSLVEKGYSLCP